MSEEKKDQVFEQRKDGVKPLHEKPVTQEPVPVAAKEDDELERLKRERDEYLDLLQRTRAEFSNYRKRVERERSEMCSFAVGDFVKALLPILDDLERAVRSARDTGDLQASLAGVRIVADHLSKVLGEHGVSAISPEGERFDPQFHQAVLMEPHPELEPGTVSEVMHKGYLMKDRVLRPASVKVVAASAAESAGESSGPGPAEPEAPREDQE